MNQPQSPMPSLPEQPPGPSARPGAGHPDLAAEAPAPVAQPSAVPTAPNGLPATVARPDDELAPPRARRVSEGAWLGGVCTGIAQHLGWPLLVVRGGFVVLGSMQMLGVFLYGLLWMLMPSQQEESAQNPEAPGLEAAKRQDMRRPGSAMVRAKRDGAAVGALALIGGGTVLLAERFGAGPSSAIFWPLAFAAVGLTIVWRQADAPRPSKEELAQGGRLDRLLLGRGWAEVVRMVVGLGLVGVSVSMVAASQIGVAQLPIVLGFSALMLLGVTIAAAPWIAKWRRASQSAHERAVLEQARADMAAHLHDSVLQTLALIQRQSNDPKAVASLARRQERELRTWLYGEVPAETTLKAALTRACTEIEDERGVEIELVCVGDVDTDSRTDAVVRAAREAMMNAAKHSGAPRIDVYCEVEPGLVEVFVRDRGAGFELAAIGDDRMGVKRSIIERMERHGGSARIRSAPGEGTEVRLVMEIEREQ
ncbi:MULTISPECIES: ATP-binding protein [unclassified Luteococcus]|uniref:ATP-binding protein n=1 Tax=unclassified Luteococcus TaxID=2639923 RepID=UPI00313D0D44